jgi:hypothetical protein
MSAQPPHASPGFPPGHGNAYSAPAAGPKPLARRAVLPLTLVHVALSGLIIFAPIVLLASGSGNPAPHRIWQHFREGGWGMWVITLFQMLLALLSAVLGALMIRGQRVPGAVLFTLALGPFAVALLGTLSAHRMIMDAISGVSVDASQKARILAMGLSEQSSLSIYGAIGAGFAMYLAGLAATLTLVTIDPAPLAPPPPSNAWIGGLAAGLIAAIAATLARIALGISIGGLDVLVVFGLLTVGGLASLAARPLPALLAARNDDEAGAAWRLLLVAAFAFAAAMLFIDRAATSATLRLVLGAIAGESVDPSQRARILMELVPDQHGRPIVMLIDAAGCLAAFAAPLVAGLAAKKKTSIVGIVAAVTAILIAGLSLLTTSRLEGSISERHERLVKAERSFVASGVTLPVAAGEARTSALQDALDFTVKRDGTVSDERSENDRSDTYGRAPFAVAADVALPFELFTNKLVPALPPASSERGLGLVIAPAERHDFSALGPYAGLVGSDLQMFEVRFDAALADGLPTGSTRGSARGDYPFPASAHATALGVLVDADKARLVSFRIRSPAAGVLLADTLPMEDTPSANAERRRVLVAFKRSSPDLGSLVLAPAPGDTMGRVVVLLGSILAGLEEPSLDVVLTSDRAALEKLTTNTVDPSAASASAPGTSRIRFSDLTVSGRLAPELVTRVLRQNSGRYGFCQAPGARDARATPSEVTLRFVIDREGSPITAKVLPPASPVTAACVERATRSLSFPPPEGGIVTVTVKLTLP